MMSVADALPEDCAEIGRFLRGDASLGQTLAANLFGGCRRSDPLFERAREIVNELISGFEAGVDDFAALGMTLGSDAGRLSRDSRMSRIESLIVDAPDALEPRLRATARMCVARFVGGYLASVINGDAAWEYEFTAVIVRRLGTARSGREIANVAVEAGKRRLHVDVAFVFERQEEQWSLLAERGLRSVRDGHAVWRLPVDAVEALASGEPMAFVGWDDAPEELRAFARTEGLATALLVPLMVEGECAALLGYGRREPVPFTSREGAFAGILSAQIGARSRELRAQSRSREALDALRASEQRTREQLRKTERAADVLQRAYIPRALPSHQHLRFDAMYLPAGDEARVGGDWYDAFELDDGRLVFSVGDVAGHGLDAAVTMGFVRQAVRIAAIATRSPSDILVTANRALLSQQLSPTTAIVGVYDPAERTVHYSSAGHPPPIFVDAGGPRALPHGGLPLGVEEVAEFAVERVELEEHSALVLYTDGLIEQHRDVIAGLDRLIAEIGRLLARRGEPENWAAVIAERVLDGPANDDLAVLAIRAVAASRASGISAVQTHRDTIAWDFQAADARAIALCRNHFMRFLEPLVQPGSDLFGTELALGEVLANALVHAPGPMHVELSWERNTPVVQVRDCGRGGLPNASLPADALKENGRGMFLVEQFTERFSVARTFGGTTVTLWLALERREETIP